MAIERLSRLRGVPARVSCTCTAGRADPACSRPRKRIDQAPYSRACAIRSRASCAKDDRGDGSGSRHAKRAAARRRATSRRATDRRRSGRSTPSSRAVLAVEAETSGGATKPTSSRACRSTLGESQPECAAAIYGGAHPDIGRTGRRRRSARNLALLSHAGGTRLRRHLVIDENPLKAPATTRARRDAAPRPRHWWRSERRCCRHRAGFVSGVDATRGMIWGRATINHLPRVLRRDAPRSGRFAPRSIAVTIVSTDAAPSPDCPSRTASRSSPT